MSFLVCLVNHKRQPHCQVWMQGAFEGRHQLNLTLHRTFESGKRLGFSATLHCVDDQLSRLLIPVDPNVDLPVTPFRVAVRANAISETLGRRLREQTGRTYRDVDVAPMEVTESSTSFFRNYLFSSRFVEPFRSILRMQHAFEAGFSIELIPPD